MAAKTQGSRPPPVRTNTSHKVSPPPHSPRVPAEEKTATNKRATAVRRRSAHVHTHERRASRPATLSRRTTPQYVPKVNSKTKMADKNAEEDRDESFLNFCTYCEKQVEGNSLYCSDSCKKQDLHSTIPSHPSSPPLSPFATFFPPPLDGPDIIPRASPTQSRPRSFFNSEPLPSLTCPSNSLMSMGPPPKPSALSSLQELAAALPPPSNTSKRPSLPTSHPLPSPPRESPLSKSASVAGGVWNYISHAGAKPASYLPPPHKGFLDNRGYKTSTPTPSTTPTQHSWMGMGYAGAVGGTGTGLLPSAPVSSDNLYGLYGYPGPLPRRAHGRGGSVDLVTPFVGN